MFIPIQIIILILTTSYHAIATFWEDKQPPAGKLINIKKNQLHYCLKGNNNSGKPTIILDHSLGGLEGYLLIDELSKLTKVLIYDRAGYGWSEHSWKPRTSKQIVQELNTLLTEADIEPPYILIGDSFGSYNVRLYAHMFPEKVVGIVFTDGLHESEMLNLPWLVKVLKIIFTAGFLISILGSILGIIRLAKVVGFFEILKPNLRKFSSHSLSLTKRSFCHPKHWLTMAREMISLKQSGLQVSIAQNFGNLPIVNIKAKSFFHPSFWTFLIPLKMFNKLRDKMHVKLHKFSTDCTQLEANLSSHFVWIDEPHLIVNAIEILLDKTTKIDMT